MASPATGDSLTVLDPSLFVYAFFNRHRPRFGQPDSRRAMLKLLGRFVGCHRLREHREGFRVSRWWDLDLLEVHRQDDSFVRWIHRRRTQPGTLRQQAIVYSFGDTLFLHALDSREGAFDFSSAWQSLAGCARSVIAPLAPTLGPGLWGVNFLYSVLLDDAGFSARSIEDLAALLPVISTGQVLVAETGVGWLFRTGTEWIELGGVPSELAATWVLVSPKAAEPHLRTLLHSTAGSVPPLVPLVLQARHKFAVQLDRYLDDRAGIRRAKTRLDERMVWMVTAQRDYEEASRVAESDEAEELRLKTDRAHTNFSAFELAVRRVEDAGETLRVNRDNYSQGAARLLREGGEDQIFQAELGEMSRWVRQLETDTAYYLKALDRGRGTLEATQGRFNVSAERQQTRSAGLGVIQVSGLVASLLAVLVTDLLSASDFPSRRPVLAANLILLTLVGSFALVQVLLTWGRIRSAATRFAVAATPGLVATTLLALRARGKLELWFGPPAFVILFLAAYAVVRFREEKPRREDEPEWRKRKGYTSEVERLRNANEELQDLLEDLPPTRYYRVKEERSYLEKVIRKKKNDPTYTEEDIGDAIGIRYRSSPWELPVVVKRINQVLGPRVQKVEYKPGPYRAVHFDVDVLGVGTPLAEVQVRTFLQDAWANTVHDVFYKNVPSSGPWLARLLKRSRYTRWMLAVWASVLGALGALEMRLFGGWMRWGETRSTADSEEHGEPTGSPPGSPPPLPGE